MAVHLANRAMSPRITVMSVSNETRNGAAVRLTVHQNSLRDIISIMSSDDVINSKLSCTTVERLSSEYTTESTVVLLAHLANDLVHGPTIQLIVGEDLQGKAILYLVLLDGLRRSAELRSGDNQWNSKRTSSESSR